MPCLIARLRDICINWIKTAEASATGRLAQCGEAADSFSASTKREFFRWRKVIAKTARNSSNIDRIE